MSLITYRHTAYYNANNDFDDILKTISNNMVKHNYMKCKDVIMHYTFQAIINVRNAV